MHTILVTGGLGFIGHHLVKELVARKFEVIIVDNLTNENKSFMNELEFDSINGNVSLSQRGHSKRTSVIGYF